MIKQLTITKFLSGTWLITPGDTVSSETLSWFLCTRFGCHTSGCGQPNLGEPWENTHIISFQILYIKEKSYINDLPSFSTGKLYSIVTDNIYWIYKHNHMYTKLHVYTCILTNNQGESTYVLLTDTLHGIYPDHLNLPPYISYLLVSPNL